MKWLFVFLAVLCMAVPAIAGEPYAAIVGNDIGADTFYFDPIDQPFLYDQESLGVPVCSGGKCEKFNSQNKADQPEICDATGTSGIHNAVTQAGNSGWYEWWVRLPTKPSGEINIVIRCGVLKPNAFAAYGYGAIELCAAEAGQRVGFGTCVRQEVDPGVSPVNNAALPTLTAVAHPGPNHSFTPFHLTAFKNPGSYVDNDSNLQALDGNSDSDTRIMLKACQGSTVVAKLPVTDHRNALKETESDLKAGDLIYVRMDVPSQNTVDIYCHAQSASLRGVGGQVTSPHPSLKQLDVKAIDQADPAYIWYDSDGTARVAGCVPASLAMMIDYVARTVLGTPGIDFPLVLDGIRNQYQTYYDSNWLNKLKSYLKIPIETTVKVDADFLNRLGGHGYSLNLGNNQYAQIEWNGYFNNANSYEETLHNIKESINYRNPVGIVVSVLEDNKKINMSASEWVLGKNSPGDWLGGHMMVITGYDNDPSCTDNPDHICTFTVNDTWSNTPHHLYPHRIVSESQHGIAFTHDTKSYIFVSVPGNSAFPLIVTEAITITSTP